MSRILFFISVLFSVLISCSDDIQKYDADVYENAVKYLSQNMNKYVKNSLISQKWEKDNPEWLRDKAKTKQFMKMIDQTTAAIEKEDETRIINKIVKKVEVK